MRWSTVLFYGALVIGGTSIFLGCGILFLVIGAFGMDAPGTPIVLYLFVLSIPVAIIVVSTAGVKAALRLWRSGRTRQAWVIASILFIVPVAAGLLEAMPANSVPSILRQGRHGTIDAATLNARLRDKFPIGIDAESVRREFARQGFMISYSAGKAYRAQYIKAGGTDDFCRRDWSITWATDSNDHLSAIDGQMVVQCPQHRPDRNDAR